MKKINVMFGTMLTVAGLLFTATGCAGSGPMIDDTTPDGGNTSGVSELPGLKEVTDIEGGEIIPGVPIIQPREEMTYYYLYSSDEVRDADDGANPSLVYVPLDTDTEDPLEWLEKSAELIEEAGVYTGVKIVPAGIDSGDRAILEMYQFDPIDRDSVSTIVSTSYSSNGEAGVGFPFLEGTEFDGVIIYNIL